MLKERKNTYSLHDYTNDLFATYSFIFEIYLILLDSVFLSFKPIVLLYSEKVLLYLYDTKLIPYRLLKCFFRGQQCLKSLWTILFLCLEALKYNCYWISFSFQQAHFHSEFSYRMTEIVVFLRQNK